MTGDPRQDLEKFTIGRERDARDFPVMIGEKSGV